MINKAVIHITQDGETVAGSSTHLNDPLRSGTMTANTRNVVKENGKFYQIEVSATIKIIKVD